MKYEQVLELEERALKNAHYQYKGLTKEQLYQKGADALMHSGKFSEEKVEEILNSWSAFITANIDPTVTRDGLKPYMESFIRLRFLAQTNLFFLCHLLESYKDTTEYTHEEICNDFFVAKDPTFKTFKDFADQYKDLKQRLLLVPRGGFKSSIDIADCIQWIVCFPEITILILTGVYDLAGSFVGELRSHFKLTQTGLIVNKKPQYSTKKMVDGTYSFFQVLFPEHCIKENEGTELEFDSPASPHIYKEPTVKAAGIEQALSGFHFCILKLDDVVTNENSLTLERMIKVNKQISIDNAMLHPFGFFDVIGTWYHEADYYGITIKQEEEAAKEENRIAEVSGDVFGGVFNSKINWIIYLRACWWPKPEAKNKIEEELLEQDMILWFPESLTYKLLKQKQKGDLEGFAIKYLNNPRKAHSVKFPRDLLVRRVIPATMLPPTGMVVSTWDTAYSVQSWADYTVGITALIYGGRFYIIDIVRGRFNEYELPKVIASTGNKWKPKRIAIEDSVGVRWIGREIRREMDNFGISIPLEFVPLGKGTSKRNKEEKAKPVVRLLGDERMFFSNSSSSLEEAFAELEIFPNGSHDDVASGLSLLVEVFGPYAEMDSRINSIQSDYVADMKSKARHDLVYGLGKYAKFNANYALSEENFADMPSYVNTAPVNDSSTIDPLSDLL